MNEQLKAVKEFHEKFKQDVGFSPCNISGEEAQLRTRLMQEEMDEYIEAVKTYDIVGIADALGDQLYILLGTMLKHGMDGHIIDIFNEIHRSNMSKLDENGQPILREDGKILKGPNYSPPNLRDIFFPF